MSKTARPDRAAKSRPRAQEAEVGLKIAPFRLLAPRPLRDAIARLGLTQRDLSPRAKARLLDLLADVDRMREETDRLLARVSELEELADADPLADVPNRRAFERELSKLLAFASRHGGPVSVLYIDLDGFKAINDAHGHRAGDAMIVHVAGVLKVNLRETDSVGRLGGDEFAVALARADGVQAAAKAGDLKERIAGAELEFEGVRLRVGASIGVYEAAAGDTAESAIRAADAAMYARKKAALGVGAA
jgi:diguanylate cyclase (GGDEF)-like protein